MVGAAGFGRESLDVLEAMKADGAAVEILGVIDDSPTEKNLTRLAQRGVDYLGTIKDWLSRAREQVHYYVLGIGNPLVRSRLVEQFETAGISPFSAVHPTAIVGSRVKGGPGALICAGAVISTNVQFGKHVHVNPNATIGHDVILADFVSVNPGAVVSGEVIVERQTLLGAQSTILQGLRIGERTIVGAMACVTRDVPSGVVVRGVPARV